MSKRPSSYSNIILGVLPPLTGVLRYTTTSIYVDYRNVFKAKGGWGAGGDWLAITFIFPLFLT